MVVNGKKYMLRLLLIIFLRQRRGNASLSFAPHSSGAQPGVDEEERILVALRFLLFKCFCCPLAAFFPSLPEQIRDRKKVRVITTPQTPEL